jgi:spore coat polysaccharide biosynthesis protein SpsF (cytidylyltransferase family)
VTNNLKKNAPKGLTMELIKFENFKKFKNMTKNEKEHICNYFYNKPKKFKIFNVNKKIYNINKNLSLGLDNKEDLFLTRKIFKTFNFNYLINLKKIILHYKKLINKDEIYKNK